MSSPSFTSALPPVREPMSVLASARDARLRSEAAEAQMLVDAVDWAVANPAVFARDAAVAVVQEWEGQRPATEALCAEGVPEVDRAAVAELGIALGTSTQAAQSLIADALELAYRLPAMWTRTVAGEVKPWRARQVAQATRPLNRLAAAYVDKHLAPVAHTAGVRVLERLVATAIARHDTETAERIAAERADGRFVQIDLEETTLGGLTPLTGAIDVPDALDLQAALAHGAAQLAAWGSEESPNARRARALGDLARQHLAWNGQPTGGGSASQARSTHGSNGSDGVHGGQEAPSPAGAEVGVGRVPPKRQVVLYLHLTDAALLGMLEVAGGSNGTAGRGGGTGTSFDPEPRTNGSLGGTPIGRVENTGTPVTAETIREWCGDTQTRVSVRPVLDLAETLHADCYEVPARLREQIRLRDGTCIFPGCRAKALYCQDDHIVPYDHVNPEHGGQTETSGLALLCQKHHNLKTHHGFTYLRLANGGVYWRTPHGLRARRATDGTTTVTGLPARARSDPEAAWQDSAQPSSARTSLSEIRPAESGPPENASAEARSTEAHPDQPPET